MCGIIAVSSENAILSKEIAEKSLEKIQHRGPDNSSIFNDNNISLGSCRLSIFDLSNKANMPMQDATGRYTISYNGEIYNFIEIKEKFNIKTKTESDTEVLIELYSLLKEECLKELNGIFSFIIYDKLKNIFFCARDRLGVKPFYFTSNETINFHASSEIQAISNSGKENFNLNYVKNYLETSFYDYGKETFFNNIYQLLPGSYLKYHISDKKIEIVKYWDLKSFKKNDLNEHQILKLGNELIESSFKLQVRSDTKLGLNLSSGIDSHIMIHFVDKINSGQKNISANSFYFENEKYNERSDLETLSQKYNWKVNFFKITEEDVISNFDKVLKAQEGPFPGLPTIAKQLLIERAYNKDCKVILEGQGGDDIAGGYKYIIGNYFLELLKNFDFQTLAKEFLLFSNKEKIKKLELVKTVFNNFDFINNSGYSADGTRGVVKNILNKNLLSKKNNLLKTIFDDSKSIKSDLNKVIYRDLMYTKLQRILKSCDRASMINSKELRVPLLDHRLVEFFFSLPSKYKIRNGSLRYIYRKIFAQNILNPEEAFKVKLHRSDPQIEWLSAGLFDWAYSILSDRKTWHDGIYDTHKLLERFEKFKKISNNKNSNFIWQALCIKRMMQNTTNDEYISK